MKKIYILIIACVCLLSNVNSQIVYNNSDMPNANDTIRISTGMMVIPNDFTATGTNYSWDFSGLIPLTQRLDSFVSMSSIPFAYQLVFNSFLDPNRATIAGFQPFSFQTPDSMQLPDIQISDAYAFYRGTNSKFSLVGYGAKLNGLTIPLKFQTTDVLYTFPVTMGNIDSSQSSFGLSLPGYGYFGEVKNRKNIVDGWGTIITPYGSFPTIRIKSEISATDTFYLDSMAIGQSIKRQQTEYKWLAKGFGEPILTITQTPLSIVFEYIDSLRNILPPVSVSELNKKANHDIQICPNPSTGYVSINFYNEKTEKINLSIYSIVGNKLLTLINSEVQSGNYINNFNLKNVGLKEGIYLLVLDNGTNKTTKRLIIK